MKVVAYCRYSSDNQRDESIDAQVRFLNEFANKNGYEIIKVYVDEAKSATTDLRPAFLEMMRAAEKGNFKAVLVHKLDRFARDRYDSAFYKRHLKKNGVRLISALENLDDSPESIILESVLEGMSEYYSKNLSREVMKGLKENAYNCKHTGGTPPLGYDVTSELTYIINEVEANVVRYIFEQKAIGKGYLTIADQLNNMGHTTKAGNHFKANSIRDILKNIKYTGVYIFNRRAAGKLGNYVNKQPHEIIKIDGGMPRIIENELFERVNFILDNRQYGPRKNSKQNYLLTGLITCKKCGSSYTGQSYVTGRGGKKYYQYGCSKKYNSKTCDNKDVRQDSIEELVLNEIIKNVLNPTSIEKISNRIVDFANDSLKTNDQDIRKLKIEIDKVSSKIEKLLDLYLDGNMDKTMYNSKTKELKISQESLVYEYQLRISESNLKVSKKEIVAYMNKLCDNLLGDDFEGKRSVISTIVKSISVNQDDIDVELVLSGLDWG